jgi:hypothetical protein
MTFISNVTFGPRCTSCKGPNAHPSWYGLLCQECHFDIRAEAWLNPDE